MASWAGPCLNCCCLFAAGWQGGFAVTVVVAPYLSGFVETAGQTVRSFRERTRL